MKYLIIFSHVLNKPKGVLSLINKQCFVCCRLTNITVMKPRTRVESLRKGTRIANHQLHHLHNFINFIHITCAHRNTHLAHRPPPTYHLAPLTVDSTTWASPQGRRGEQDCMAS